MRKGARFPILIGAAVWLSISVRANADAPLLHDDFNGSIVSAARWHIPTWVSPTDGTFVGRTQFKTTQSEPLPAASGGNAVIDLETHNPTGFSFYGTDLISDQSFSVGQGLLVTVRAKMNSPFKRGTVGGIFLYALTSQINSLHDEIDFELLGNRPGDVQTNIYANEPLGAGHPQFTPYAYGAGVNYHTYQIHWLPDRVSWYIDGGLIRTDTTHVPAGPMYFHLNLWAPDSGWAEAYDVNLQPVNSASANQVFSMNVDFVTIESSTTPPQKTGVEGEWALYP